MPFSLSEYRHDLFLLRIHTVVQEEVTRRIRRFRSRRSNGKTVQGADRSAPVSFNYTNQDELYYRDALTHKNYLPARCWRLVSAVQENVLDFLRNKRRDAWLRVYWEPGESAEVLWVGGFVPW